MADPRLKRAGVSGFNKPKRTPNHPKKSHVVVAKEGSTVKTIRFGQQGVTGDRKPTARQASFKARHAKNIAKGKMSAAYWADKVKWQQRKNQQLTQQVITLNLECVLLCLRKLRLALRVETLENGLLVKHSCLLHSIKKQAEVTSNGTSQTSTIFKKLDSTKMEDF